MGSDWQPEESHVALFIFLIESFLGQVAKTFVAETEKNGCLKLGTSDRWSPYSRTAPLSWSWDFTCNRLFSLTFGRVFPKGCHGNAFWIQYFWWRPCTPFWVSKIWANHNDLFPPVGHRQKWWWPGSGKCPPKPRDHSGLGIIGKIAKKLMLFFSWCLFWP